MSTTLWKKKWIIYVPRQSFKKESESEKQMVGWQAKDIWHFHNISKTAAFVMFWVTRQTIKYLLRIFYIFSTGQCEKINRRHVAPEGAYNLIGETIK